MLDTPSQAPACWLVSQDEDVYERLANSGGPCSRRRTELLSATLLGRKQFLERLFRGTDPSSAAMADARGEEAMKDKGPGARYRRMLDEDQGVGDLADDKPGMKRLLGLARIWQERDLTPLWTADWTNKVFVYTTVDGATATIEPVGPGVRFRVGDETVYQRVKGTGQVVSSLFIPGWPAYDEGSIFGLDPSREYWLEPTPRPRATPRG